MGPPPMVPGLHRGAGLLRGWAPSPGTLPVPRGLRASPWLPPARVLHIRARFNKSELVAPRTAQCCD